MDESVATDDDPRVAAFRSKYEAVLRGHVDEPSEHGPPPAADELGQLARVTALSMLQVVGMHLEIRREIVAERGIEHLGDLDVFLSATLAAFDSSGWGGGESSQASADRDRLEWLRGLSDSYIAIASGATLQDRLAEVCVQARRFLGAANARLAFGRETETEADLGPGDEISARLLGNAGLLTVTAPPGRMWTDAERTALQQLAALISAPINDARRLESAERAGEIGILLGGVAGPDDVLDRFHDVGIGLIGAARATVRFFDGGAERHERESADVALTVDEVARTGDCAFIDGAADGRAGVWAVLPVGTGANGFGVLSLEFDEPQPFDEVQQSFLADVGRRLTAALDRSRAYASERTARQEAEVAWSRLRDLQGLASDLARAATRRRVAQVLLRRAVVSCGATTGIVAMYTSHPEVEVLAASGPFRNDKWGDVGASLATVLAGATAKVGRRGPFAIIDASTLQSSVGEQLVTGGLAQLAWLSIMSGEREIGILLLGWADAVEDRSVDRGLLQAQVAMAGSTLRRAARYDVEHAIADTLQRSMLALPPIITERVRWSVLYRAGSAGLAGGDWYDLIEIDEDRVAIVVGDIVGRGVDAAASMGQLRSATRALAMHIDAPGELIAALDEYTSNTGQGRFSSLAYLVLDTRSGDVAHSVAGHPPPILHFPDGHTAVLDTGRGPLLGVCCPREDAVIRIAPGTRIVMYTDGLVDRRGESVDLGIERLVTAVQAQTGRLDPDEICKDLIDRLLDTESDADGARDDVAIVVVELLGS